MANSEHLKILKQGVEIWNKWRDENETIRPDLSNANLNDINLTNINLFEANLYKVSLQQADLTGANLSNTNLYKATLLHATLIEAHLIHSHLHEANLKQANLRGAQLYNAILYAANLCGAELSEAKLGGANLTQANLRKAILNDADLQSANLKGADLSEATMRKAILGDTIFGDCNLTGVKDLETCQHRDWSIIDHRTLSKSGYLPLSFLRGCGLPDFIIDNIQVLQNNPILFYSCFISYSVKDESFANRLYVDLQNKGIRCWYAPEDMRGGKKIYDQVNQALRVHDKLLLILSEHSMSSNWVATEIKKARERERHEGRQMLFPIGLTSYERIKEWELFDSDEGSDLAAQIRSYHIPDFSKWEG